MNNRIELTDAASWLMLNAWRRAPDPVPLLEYYNNMGWDIQLQLEDRYAWTIPEHQLDFFLLSL